MTRVAFVALFALVGTTVRATDQAADEAKKLQGEWQAVEVESQGKKVSKDNPEVKNLRFIFDGHGISLPIPGGGGQGRKKTYKLDPTKSPREIDITSLDGQEKDQTAACIYKLDGDRLTICMPYFTKDPTIRPKEFKAGAGDGIMVITLQRTTATQPPAQDRTIAKEPAYKTKEPRYCQLVFGPEAKQSVWLVIDGEDLYVDRNGNGDLTKEGARVVRKPAFQGGGFEVQELGVGDGKITYSNLIVYWTPQPLGGVKKEYTVDVLVDVDKRYCQTATFSSSAKSPEDAPVIHFGGPLEMVLLGGDAPLAAPGKEREVNAVIGTKSATGHVAMVRHDRNLSPKADNHPVAEITFPVKPGDGKPVPLKFSLDERCCNVRFFATLKTPAEVGTGKATITLSFPGWTDAKVGPTTKELAVAESIPEK